MANTVSMKLMNTVVAEKENTMETMTVKDYAEAIASRIEGAEVHEVVKNNGIVKQGITVRSAESNVAPTIYVDSWFENDVTVEEAVAEALKLIAENKTSSVDLNWFSDFEAVAPLLRMKLVSKANINEEAIYMSAENYGFEDLILIPYVSLAVHGIAGTIRITKNHISVWKKSAEDVCKVAMENTLADKDDAELTPMGEMLEAMGMPFDEALPLDVVTSKDHINGAVMAIVMADELKEKYPNGYIILPSSVHEVLVLPKDIPQEMMGLAEMIKQVNASCVKPEEVLSDRPYEFAA